MKLKIVGKSNAEHLATAKRLRELYNMLLEKKFKRNAVGWHLATEKARADIIAKKKAATNSDGTDWHAVNLAMITWLEKELGIASNTPRLPSQPKPRIH